ncbi:hypothetical protein BKA70DRAFT_1395462 [Coprinopsis sp. MPI-PUGE-AT-0042]|nr:hypothetical protein BKA70DRAFT_1395462 [Coprinopsis sp. MPI-PUGE-AT-0042]
MIHPVSRGDAGIAQRSGLRHSENGPSQESDGASRVHGRPSSMRCSPNLAQEERTQACGKPSEDGPHGDEGHSECKSKVSASSRPRTRRSSSKQKPSKTPQKKSKSTLKEEEDWLPKMSPILPPEERAASLPICNTRQSKHRAAQHSPLASGSREPSSASQDTAPPTSQRNRVTECPEVGTAASIGCSAMVTPIDFPPLLRPPRKRKQLRIGLLEPPPSLSPLGLASSSSPSSPSMVNLPNLAVTFGKNLEDLPGANADVGMAPASSTKQEDQPPFAILSSAI